jgi:hypothetical protein
MRSGIATAPTLVDERQRGLGLSDEGDSQGEQRLHRQWMSKVALQTFFSKQLTKLF